MKKIPDSAKSISGAVVLEVADLSDKGEGLAYLDGMELYVRNALPGDLLKVRVLPAFVDGSKRHPVEVLEILERSSSHADPAGICPHQGQCGGCPLGGISYEAQLEFKRGLILKALHEGGIDNAEVASVMPSPTKEARFKSIRYFGQDGDLVVSGFYQNRSHDVCPVGACPLEQEWFGALAGKISAAATELGLCAYDESLHTGALRAAMMRDCGDGGRLCVLTHDGELPDTFLNKLKELYLEYGIRAGFIQCNHSQGNRVLSGKMQCLTAESAVTARLGDFQFVAGPNTFLQVNYEVAQKLYAAAVSWCGTDPKARALDLCCGCGTMTLPLSKHFAKVTGVEIVEEAVAAARNNAALNGVNNADFIAADLKKVIAGLVKDDGLPVRAVIADPARAGLGAENCKALGRLKGPVKLAVIFCGLKALSRDLPVLLKSGFKLREIRGFDMFPGSMGVETLVCLEK